MYQQEKETRLDIDDVRNALEAYEANIEKCQEVNSLVAACEKLEGRKQYESK